MDTLSAIDMVLISRGSQEFLDLHGSSGIQHIAFLTDDIIGAVQQLRERGVEFLDIPDSYYDMLRTRLAQRSSKRVEIEEDLDKVSDQKSRGFWVDQL